MSNELLLRRRGLLVYKKEELNIRAVCFEADGEQTVSILKEGSAPAITMQYSYNGVTWESWDLTALPFGGSTKVYVRGVRNYTLGKDSNNYNKITFGTDSYVYVSGITEALLDGENEVLTIKNRYCFYKLFGFQSNLRSVKNLRFEAISIGANACYSMFESCSNLLYAPKVLSANNFSGSYVYTCMFQNCTSMITAPELPATTLSSNCYDSMFRGCTSLVNAPELPATTLTPNCYQYMFYGCISLVNVPKLPATTLSSNCYRNMFRNCSSLVNAPELPATTLSAKCYQYMFYGCTSLKTIRCRAKVTASSATVYWLYGTSSSGTFYGHSEYGWPSGVSGIPSGWEFVELTD